MPPVFLLGWRFSVKKTPFAAEEVGRRFSVGVQGCGPGTGPVHLTCMERRGFAGAPDLGLSSLGLENFSETGELSTLLLEDSCVTKGKNLV